MGVTGLWELISEGFLERAPFDIIATSFLKLHGRPLRVAIDGYGWIFEILSSSGIQNANSSYVAHCVAAFNSRIKYLLKLNVSFVVVLDGKHKPIFKRNFANENKDRYEQSMGIDEDYMEKYRAVIRELNANPEIDIGDVFTSMNILGNYNTSEFAEIVREIKRHLHMWNISYMVSPAEAEADCAYLQHLGVVDYAMSNDVDCLIYGADRVLRNFSKFIEDRPASNSKSILHQETSRWATPVHMDRVERVTGFNRWRMLLFALLNGSDYSGGMKNMGAKRAAAMALMGSPKMKLFVDTSTKKNKSKDNAVELKDTDVPDFAMILRDIYLSENVYSTNDRLAQLADFKIRLKHYLTNYSYKFFERNLSKTTFLENDKLAGFPSDYIILLFFYPMVNKINIFSFLDGMTNFAETGQEYVTNDIEPSMFDLDRVHQAIGAKPNDTDIGVSIKKVRIRRVSGVNSQYDYIACDNVYTMKPVSRKWKLESLHYRIGEYEEPTPLLSWEKKLKYPDFEAMLANALNSRNAATTDTNNQLSNNKNPRDWLVKELDQCYLVYFLAQNQQETNPDKKKEIYIDRIKSIAYPIKRRNLKYCESNSIQHHVDLVRVSYHKNQLFNKIIPKSFSRTNSAASVDGVYEDHYIAISSESESGISTDDEENKEDDGEKDNEEDEEDEDEEKVKKQDKPKLVKRSRKKRDAHLISCWIPREIINYYVPSVLKEFEIQEQIKEKKKAASAADKEEKKKSKPVKRSRSYTTQKTKLDTFGFLHSSSKEKNLTESLSDERLSRTVNTANKNGRSLQRNNSNRIAGMMPITDFFKPRGKSPIRIVAPSVPAKSPHKVPSESVPPTPDTVTSSSTRSANRADSVATKVIRITDEDTTMGITESTIEFIEHPTVVADTNNGSRNSNNINADDNMTADSKNSAGMDNSQDDQDEEGRLEKILDTVDSPFGMSFGQSFMNNGSNNNLLDKLDTFFDSNNDSGSELDVSIGAIARRDKGNAEYLDVDEEDKSDDDGDDGSNDKNPILVGSNPLSEDFEATQQVKRPEDKRENGNDEALKNSTKKRSIFSSSGTHKAQLDKPISNDKQTKPRNGKSLVRRAESLQELGWSDNEFTDEGFSSDMAEFDELMERISPTKKAALQSTPADTLTSKTPTKIRVVDLTQEENLTPLRSAKKKTRAKNEGKNDDDDEAQPLLLLLLFESSWSKPHYVRKIDFSDKLLKKDSLAILDKLLDINTSDSE